MKREQVKKLCAALSALLLLISPVVGLAGVRDGDAPSNGKPREADPAGLWDGTSHRHWRGDPNGIGRVTEEYPAQLQTDVFTSALAVPVTTGLKQIGNGWTHSPFGYTTLRVTRAATGGSSVNPLYLYLYGSDDNVNFYPVAGVNAFVAGTQAPGDTVQVDTLRVNFPNFPASVTIKFSLPPGVYPGKYAVIFAKRDSAASTAQTLSIVREGRWQ